MVDMIPASKVAAAALAQVRQAADNVPESYHDSGKIKQQAVHLQVAVELLLLIAAPAPMAIHGDEVALTMLPPPEAPQSA